MWFQREIKIKRKARGFYIITDEILKNIPEISEIKIGIMNLFIQHTSASIAINENVSSDVRRDFERYFNKIVPEDLMNYEHIHEGNDDLPAHIKSTMIGQSINIPITNGKLNLGIWQGIYLCEHRNYSGDRNLVITICGE